MINKNKIRKLTTAAVLSALSVVMVMFLRTPLFASAPFLEYDPADIPILLGGIFLGPFWGLAMTVAVSAIQATTVSAQSGVYGFIMHVIATGTLVLTVTVINRYIKIGEKAKLITSVIIGVITATAVMVGANLIITPAFTGWPVSSVKEILLPIIIPFNLIKLGGNAALTVVLYKVLNKYIHRFIENSRS
ncbi:MAG: ECF transporter S component [Firmicutes bacterium HGW-Firmicutes-21]|nr:MAG: ECF transporter S component [Firmicutes bacterium HGW-Firmicutes-21]